MREWRKPTDQERLAAAKEFFDKMIGDQIFTPQTYWGQIAKIASTIPPFTRVPPPLSPSTGEE